MIKIKYEVVLERSGYEHSKTVKVSAYDLCGAMAEAMLKHSGWVAVDAYTI